MHGKKLQGNAHFSKTKETLYLCALLKKKVLKRGKILKQILFRLHVNSRRFILFENKKSSRHVDETISNLLENDFGLFPFKINLLEKKMPIHRNTRLRQLHSIRKWSFLALKK